MDRYFGGTIYDPIPVDVLTAIGTGGMAGITKGVGSKIGTEITETGITSEFTFDLQLFGQKTVKDILKTKKGSI